MNLFSSKVSFQLIPQIPLIEFQTCYARVIFPAGVNH